MVWTLKLSVDLSVDAERPSGGGQSFASGHAATAAFGAGYMHRRYGLRYALPLYLATGFVAWSRYDAGAHRPLDLVVRIAIGIGASMVITTPWEREVVIAPLALEGGLGALVAVRF